METKLCLVASDKAGDTGAGHGCLGASDTILFN